MHRPRPLGVRACTKFPLVVVRHLRFQVCVKVERILESLRGYMRRICSTKLRKPGLDCLDFDRLGVVLRSRGRAVARVVVSLHVENVC
jgi:hypothetical protein